MQQRRSAERTKQAGGPPRRAWSLQTPRRLSLADPDVRVQAGGEDEGSMPAADEMMRLLELASSAGDGTEAERGPEDEGEGGGPSGGGGRAATTNPFEGGGGGGSGDRTNPFAMEGEEARGGDAAATGAATAATSGAGGAMPPPPPRTAEFGYATDEGGGGGGGESAAAVERLQGEVMFLQEENRRLQARRSSCCMRHASSCCMPHDLLPQRLRLGRTSHPRPLAHSLLQGALVPGSCTASTSFAPSTMRITTPPHPQTPPTCRRRCWRTRSRR